MKSNKPSRVAPVEASDPDTRMNSLRTVILVCVFVLATLIRTVDITVNPAGFFCDEAINGINAYSIKDSYRDREGILLPVIFRALDDYRGGTFVYSLFPLTYLLPPAELTVRLGSAIYGILTVILLFVLVRRLFSFWVGALASFVLAVTPWHIHYSRIGYEISASVFWYMMCIYWWVRVRNTPSALVYGLFVLSLFCTFFSYAPAKIAVVVLIGVILLIDRSLVRRILTARSTLIVTLLALCVLVIILWPFVHDGSFFQRLYAVNEGARNGWDMIRSYFAHFDFGFLFRYGEYGYPGSFISRQSLRDYGELHPLQSVFILSGIVYCVGEILNKRDNTRGNLIFLTLLIVYPLNSIFTTQIPSATHSLQGVVPFAFFTGYGIWHVFNWFTSRSVKVIVVCVMVLAWTISVSLYIGAYRRYPTYSTGYYGWQYGYRQAMEALERRGRGYDRLFVTHRFNAGDALLEYYKRGTLCTHCEVMNNPIRIDPGFRELFALRQDDIDEAKVLYPELTFMSYETIEHPLGGGTQLWVGEFRPTADTREQTPLQTPQSSGGRRQ